MITNDDKAILLLCSYIGLKDETLKPLTLTKWNKLANAIFKSNVKRPGNLFGLNEIEIMKELNLSNIEAENISKLLSRSLEFAVELETLNSKGIHILTRASNFYPIRLKKILKDLAPPVLFYCGNLSLIDKDGIGIVGSRKVEEQHIYFTQELVKKAVSEDLIIYSGGAKGIDSIAEKEAFLNGGSYVSFLSDSLERKIKDKDIRQKIQSGRALLITSSKPDAGFQVGLAMNRNKYVYASSKATFVIASDYNKGGTWAGAIENMRNNWTKTFVRQDVNSKGVQGLINLGACPIENINGQNLLDLINNDDKINKNNLSTSEQININDLIVTSNEKNNQYIQEVLENVVRESEEIQYDINNKKEKNYDLYYYVIDTIVEALGDGKGLKEIVEILNLRQGQVSDWLKRGIEDGKIRKVTKPNVKYVGMNKK